MASDLYVHKVLQWPKPGIDGITHTPNEPYWKAVSAAERHSASTHCGPHESYPLGPGCKHVSAAFTLAMSGHGHPSLACIRNYARTHGCAMPPSQKAMEWLETGCY